MQVSEKLRNSANGEQKGNHSSTNSSTRTRQTCSALNSNELILGLFAGVVLKARDATSFTKMISEGGISKVKTQKLAEGERLAEANFFVAHLKTGRGLYAYHHRSASITSDFSWLCGKAFYHEKRRLLAERLAQAGLTVKEKKAFKCEPPRKFSLWLSINRQIFSLNFKALKD